MRDQCLCEIMRKQFSFFGVQVIPRTFVTIAANTRFGSDLGR